MNALKNRKRSIASINPSMPSRNPSAKRHLVFILALLLALCLLPLPSRAADGNWTDGLATAPDGYADDGSGTITVTTAEGLAWLAVQTDGLNGVTPDNFSGKTVVLGADIDLSGKNWTPIGTANAYFQGSFDGQGHTISGMTLHADGTEKTAGLFGRVFFNGSADAPAYIRDLALADIRMTIGAIPSFSYAGGLVGEAMAGCGLISGCTVSGQIQCTAPVSALYTGGLIGMVNPTSNVERAIRLENCHADVEISGSLSKAGGFVGGVGDNADIAGCGASGNSTCPASAADVQSGGFAGEIAPVNGSVSIRNCYATGDSDVASAGPSYAGGFAGYVGGTGILLKNCMSSGSVSLSSASPNPLLFAGGFGGVLMDGTTSADCYATGSISVSGGAAAIGGGFSGTSQNSAAVNCYAAGNVTASGDGQNRAYGFTGNASAGSDFENCYALGKEMSASGGTPTVSPFLSTNASVTVTDCGWHADMDFGSLTPISNGGTNNGTFDALRPEEIVERLSALPDSSWTAGEDGRPILKDVPASVQTTGKLDYVYPVVTFDTMGGSPVTSRSVAYGKTVAPPEPPVRDGYRFDGWYESNDGGTTLSDAPFDFGTAVTRTMTLYAKWIPLHAIRLQADPAEGGTVAGAGTYPAGETVTVTAVTAEGWQFLRWTEDGQEVSTEADYSFPAEADRTLTAEFKALPEITVTLLASPSRGGTVSGGGTFREGQPVAVTAVPEKGYRFVRWSENGRTVSESQTFRFTASTNRALTAEFESSETQTAPGNDENQTDPGNGGGQAGSGNGGGQTRPISGGGRTDTGDTRPLSLLWFLFLTSFGTLFALSFQAERARKR